MNACDSMRVPLISVLHRYRTYLAHNRYASLIVDMWTEILLLRHDYQPAEHDNIACRRVVCCYLYMCSQYSITKYLLPLAISWT